MISYWKYDSAANKAVQQNVDTDRMMSAFHKSTEQNFFRIYESGTVVSAENPKYEMICLNDVTPEQIVILFATLLGMKEAAKE